MKSMAILGLGARGAETYGRFALKKDSGFAIAAICDLDEKKLVRYAKEFSVAREDCFTDAESFFSRGRLADVAVIASFDQDHCAHAQRALKLGYDLLLEKPVSNRLCECLEILRAAEASGRTVAVCHVMRYTAYYQRLKQLIEEGAAGDIVAIEQTEDVAYWHMAHGFVRGNFRRKETTSPMILQKCCHDMDLMVWLTQKQPESVSSMGSLRHFKPENAPKGSAKRCIDCPVKDCPYNAVDFYISGFESLPLQERSNRWPYIQLDPDPTVESLTEALKMGKYGRCVYACDNDVVDHQFSTVLFTDGTIGTLTMCGFAGDGGRRTHVYGTKGELLLDEQRRTIEVRRFGKHLETIRFEDLTDDFSGHGGGDARMLKAFSRALREGGDISSSIRRSVDSHILCFAAEESRLAGGSVVTIEDLLGRST